MKQIIASQPNRETFVPAKSMEIEAIDPCMLVYPISAMGENITFSDILTSNDEVLLKVVNDFVVLKIMTGMKLRIHKNKNIQMALINDEMAKIRIKITTFHDD